MPVTVNPIQKINVRVGQTVNPSSVHTTTQFIGASNPDITGAVANAAAAIILSQSAYDAANNKVDRSGDTMTGTLNIQSDLIVSNNYLDGILDAGSF
jgi:hypothetical protein